MSEQKLNIKEESSAKKTRSPPKKARVEQSVPRKKKLKTDADKAAERAQHLRFGKAELTPDELSRLSKAQKREMYAAHAARSAVHREVDQYEDDNVGTQALSEGEKTAGNVLDISKSIYARKLKKEAKRQRKMQGKKGAKTAKSSPQKPTAAQDAGASCTGEGSSNWLSRWKQWQEIRKSHYAAAHSGTAAQTAGGKAASNGTTAAKSGMEQVIDKGRSVVSTAVNGIANFAKSNAHVLLIVGVFLLLLLLVMSAFSSCSILFSGTTQVSGQTIYTAEDRDIRGAETDYKKLEKELDKKIKRTPTDHPGYNEYQYHLDPIEHDPWQLTSFLTTLYDDYTRSEVQGKLKETFKKQYKLTTWVEVQIRYKTVWVISPAGIPVPTQVPYALLCGKVFCAHCGNRLNITSSGRTRLRADGTVVKEKRYRYSCNFNVRHPGQCDGQSGYGVTTLDAVVESIVCMKFEEILECSKSNLLEEMRRKDLDEAKKETTRWKEEVQTKVDEQNALKKEMIRVIQGTSGLDREMIQQMVDENKEALLIAQTNLADSEKKLKEIEEQNQKAERNCSDLFTWASTYKGASFERRQAILKQFIKEVRVGRNYNIEIVLNVPLDEFEEFKRHAASAGRSKKQKNKSQNPQKVGRCTSNAGIVVLDKTAGETISIVPKNAAHAILRC